MAAEKTTAKERKPSSRALLSAEEVAEYFGVTMTTVYRWCREGRIPCLKIGKHWRVRREEMIAFLKESEGAERPRETDLPRTQTNRPSKNAPSTHSGE